MPEVAPIGTPTNENSVSFALGEFSPRYYPNEVDINKKRNLKREPSMCEGEYIYDLGGKNRECNIRGYILTENIPSYNAIIESGDPMTLLSMTWSGEVMIKNSSIVGPEMYDGGEQQWLYEFNIKAISTARDEPGMTNYGIINGYANQNEVPDSGDNPDNDLGDAADRGNL